MLLSGTIKPPLTTPTVVAIVGPPAAINPLPLNATVNVPVLAVGRLDGAMVLICAPGDLTATLIVTSTWLPLPQLMSTCPVKVFPGAAAENMDCRNVTEIGLPKL